MVWDRTPTPPVMELLPKTSFWAEGVVMEILIVRLVVPWVVETDVSLVLNIPPGSMLNE